MSPTDVILNGGKAAVKDHTSAESFDALDGTVDWTVYGTVYGT